MDHSWTPEKLIAFEQDIANEFNSGKIRAPIHLDGGEVWYGVIYIITNKINGRQYIGQTTSRKPINRWRGHLGEAFNGSCGYLHKALGKYGENNFSFEIVVYCFDKQSLDWAEDFFIKRVGTLTPNGYNLREGGGNGKFSPELCEILSEIRRRPDVVARMSIATTKAMARPEVKARQKAGLKKALETPGFLEARSVKITQAHARPEVKIKHTNAMREVHARVGFQEYRGSAIKKALATPEIKARHELGCKKAQNRPEVKEQKSKRVRAERADPKLEAQRILALKKTLAKPDVRAKKSLVMLEVRNRPGAAEKFLAGARKGGLAVKGGRWANNGTTASILRKGQQLPPGWTYGMRHR